MSLRDRCYRYLFKILRRLPCGPLSDRLWVVARYRKRFGSFPRIKRPERFSEKMQRRKLYDRNPLLPILQDKYRARDFVAERIGEEHLVPLLQVQDDPDMLDFDRLPNRFMLKANHGSGFNYFVRDKSRENLSDLRALAFGWLSCDYYKRTREWAYKDIPRLIMVEQLLDDCRGDDLPRDFKACCFDGIPRYFMIYQKRYTDDFSVWRYEVKGDALIPIDFAAITGLRGEIPCAVGDHGVTDEALRKVLRLSAILSRGIDHLRVDFYHVDDKIYFGEFSPYHYSGLMEFRPDSYDYELGSWWSQPY